MMLLPLAWDHAAEASLAHGETGEAHHPIEIAASVQAVILAAAAMESYTNDVGMTLLGQDAWIAFDRNQKPVIKDKWKEIQSNSSGFSTDFGTNPWADVIALFKLRNFVMHFQPELTTPVKSIHGNESEFGAKFTYKAAVQAVKNVKSAILEYEQAAGGETGWLSDLDESSLKS